MEDDSEKKPAAVAKRANHRQDSQDSDSSSDDDSPPNRLKRDITVAAVKCFWEQCETDGIAIESLSPNNMPYNYCKESARMAWKQCKDTTNPGETVYFNGRLVDPRTYKHKATDREKTNLYSRIGKTIKKRLERKNGSKNIATKKYDDARLRSSKKRNKLKSKLVFEKPCEDTIGSARRTRSTLAGIIENVSNYAVDQLQNDLPAQVRENLVSPPLPATCAGHVIGEHCLPGTIPRIGWHSTTLDPRTDYVEVPGFQDLTMKVNKPVDKVQEGVFATCHSFQYALERLYRKQKTVSTLR